jgi:uncharacterized membrane protein
MNQIKRIIHSTLGKALVLCTFALILLVTAMVAGGFQESSRAEYLKQESAVLKYTKIDYPGARDTNVTGVNNQDQILGGAITIENGVEVSRGFLMKNGVFSSPIEVPRTNYTAPMGINNLGQITIATRDENNLIHGFLLDNGRFSQIDYPGSTQSGPHAINDLGNIVGFVQFGGNSLGYLLTPGGTPNPFSLIVYQKASTDAYGINNNGDIVGDFLDTTGLHGFIRRGSVFERIDYPRAPNTSARGINNNGDIVGIFGASLDTARSFLLRDNVFTEFVVPGAMATNVISIRDDGKLAGYFIDGNQRTHGFVGYLVEQENLAK